MTNQEKKAARRRLAATAAQLNRLTHERNELIAQLLDAGDSQREVGRLALMSHNGAVKAANAARTARAAEAARAAKADVA
jgi:hypothetical protein